MSRGGRGGGWGGGAGGPNAAGKMNGQALPWDWDPDLEGKLSSKPSELFPPIEPTPAPPPTWEERRIVAHYRTLRSRIHDGPFYTVLDSTARISKTGRRSPAAAHYNPFEDAPTYSQRFVRKRNTLPRLSTRPFVKELFPRELHSTLDPSTRPNTKKSLQLHTRTKDEKMWEAYLAKGGNSANDDEHPATAGADVDDDNADDDNEDGAGANKEDDEAGDDEDPDQFDEEDEDDMDDYNAEQYFDGGDDDDYGADEGGGDNDDF